MASTSSNQHHVDAKAMDVDQSINTVRPQHMGIGLDYLSGDLKLLGSMAVPIRILTQLQNLDITSFEGILLVKKEDFNAEQLNFDELRSVQDTVCRLHSDVPIQSMLELKESSGNQSKVSTGIRRLDQMIDSKLCGLPIGRITSFHGTSGSAKTLILMQTVSCCLLKGNSAVFIDCANQFNIVRFSQILQSIGSTQRVMDEDTIRRLMQRLTVYSVCGFREFCELIEDRQFEANLKRASKHPVSLLAIDDMARQTYLNELNKTFADHFAICRAGQRLKCLAKRHSLSVVTSSLAISNKYHSEFMIGSTPSSTAYANWKRFVDIEVHLMLSPRSDIVKPLVTKSRGDWMDRNDDLLLRIGHHVVDNALGSNREY